MMSSGSKAIVIALDTLGTLERQGRGAEGMGRKGCGGRDRAEGIRRKGYGGNGFTAEGMRRDDLLTIAVPALSEVSLPKYPFRPIPSALSLPKYLFRPISPFQGVIQRATH